MKYQIYCNDSHNKSLWPNDDVGVTKILLTDPPYGLNQSWKKSFHGSNGKSTLRDGKIPSWENQPIDNELIQDLVKWSDISIIFGGNFYNLPPTPCWFVWDKLQSNRGSDAELAWTNAQIKGIKVFRMSRIDAYFNKRRFIKKHIAEKPVQLFSWCLENLKVKNAMVFDPFMGTGNSGVAALESGYSFVGIDNDLQWIEEAKKRLLSATKKEK